MTIRRVDHTAIVVADMDEAIERWVGLLGATLRSRDIVPEQQVEVAFLALDDTDLELITPITPDSGVARFLSKRGESLHHVGVEVDDISQTMRDLKGNGVEMIEDSPRPSIHGDIAFIHPRSTGGVLVELVQGHAKAQSPAE